MGWEALTFVFSTLGRAERADPLVAIFGSSGGRLLPRDTPVTGGRSPPSSVRLRSLTSYHEACLAVPQVWFPHRLPQSVGFRGRAYWTSGCTRPFRFLRKWGSASALRPKPVFGLVPGPRPRTVGGDLAWRQGGHAPLPERPGLLGFVKTSGPPEVGGPGVAPLRQHPSAAHVPHGGLPDHRLAGADGATGGTQRVVQPGGGRGQGTARRLLQKRGFDPELVCRGFVWAFYV